MSDIQLATAGNEYGPFRVYFDFEGVNGVADDFVTFTREEDSEFGSVVDEAKQVARDAVSDAYDGSPDSVEVTAVEYRADYE